MQTHIQSDNLHAKLLSAQIENPRQVENLLRPRSTACHVFGHACTALWLVLVKQHFIRWCQALKGSMT